jgi:hypothetical protein
MKQLTSRLAVLAFLCVLMAVHATGQGNFCPPQNRICTDKKCNIDCLNGRIWCKTHPGQDYFGPYVAGEPCGPPIYSANQCDADNCNYCWPTSLGGCPH